MGDYRGSAWEEEGQNWAPCMQGFRVTAHRMSWLAAREPPAQDIMAESSSTLPSAESVGWMPQSRIARS